MNPFRPLHPKLKKCKCGLIGTHTEFYRHMSVQERELVTRTGKMSIQAFYERHGEVPLYATEELAPRDFTDALQKAGKRQSIIDSI